MRFVDLRNQRGDILAMTIMIGAALMIGIVVIMTLVGNANHRSQQGDFRDRVDMLMTSITAEVRTPESCTKILQQVVVNPGAKTQVTMNYKYDPTITDPFTQGSKASPTITIEKLQVTLDAQPNMTTKIDSQPGTLSRYNAHLDAVFSQPSGQLIFESRQLSAINAEDHGLPFYVWLNSKNQIKSCFGKNSSAALCNAVGGYYVVDLSNPLQADRRCELSMYTKVASGGAYKAMGSCRYAGPTTDPATCNGLYGFPYFAYRTASPLDPMPGNYLCLKCL